MGEDKYDTILGFNEPNHANQAGIPPEEAAAAWIELQTLYPDRILVSPSAAGGGDEEWFERFFAECEILGCRIDYLATHDYHGETEMVMNRLEELYNRYGRKIWLTEFAKCCTRDRGEVETFVKAIIPRLEAAEYVYRYSWFITRYNDKYSHGWNTSQTSTNDWYLDKVNALFEEGSTELSSVGILYDQL